MSDNSHASVQELVADLERSGIRMWTEEGQLRFRAPVGLMTDDRRAALRARKDEIVAHLAGGGLPPVIADHAARQEPFPITDVQSAYLLGRGRTFVYGGVACHGYGELHYPDLDPVAMTAAWRALIARHDMLRAVVESDGSQRVLPEVADFEIPVIDLRGRSAREFAAGVHNVRAAMDHRVFAPDRWPLFEARITQGDAETVMHVSVDFLIADFVSIQVLLDELHRLYHQPDGRLPALELTFRDYLLAERRWVEATGRHDTDRDYWLGRLDELPPGPEMPILGKAADSAGRFRRLATTLDAETWAGLRKHAGLHDVSPSGAVLAAYAQTIGAWSRRPAFTLNVTLLNRLPLHPQVPALIGDFTGVELLAVDSAPGERFAERARALQAQLWQDMDHRTFSGIEVMREITRRRGAEAALFPVVFTSAIGLAEADRADNEAPVAQFGYGISQTPQVIIDCQNMERDSGLATNWDVREGVLPDGVVDDMFAAFEGLLRRLASDEQAWQSPPRIELTPAQQLRREQANNTTAPLVRRRLHDSFFQIAREQPDAPAVICGEQEVRYGDLARAAAGVAQRLAELGCGRGDLVAITMERGPGQVVAVLGALLAGAVYVPIDPVQPAARRDEIINAAGIRFALVDGQTAGAAWSQVVLVTDVESVQAAGAVDLPVTGSEPGDLAYVIHTSGSTGTPKGVMITHEAALNTVLDINSRFGIEPADRVLGLSQLGFDLSVYDIFGPLSLGGTLVIPDPQRRADPSHWAEQVARHGVTVWNSVPAQMQMLSGYLSVAGAPTLASLRLAMLSGDWIPVALPDQIRSQLPELQIISLGGATEASIWSIYYPIGAVDPQWASIPYGRPLANQSFHVLDAGLNDCPDWVTGELYIGGAGLAAGYLHDEARTAQRFIIHPQTGQRLYRTGDLGRYLPDGNIEFLGREDHQVKIRGYRIELAEIEAALGSHPRVAGAAVLVDGDQPLERRLVGYLEPAVVAAPPADDALLRRLSDEAQQAGDRHSAGVDTARYLAFAHTLDQVALPAMLGTMRSAGLFAGPDERHSFAEIVAGTKAHPRHHRLVRRWLRALTTEGLLAGGEGSWQLGGTQVPPTELAWAAATRTALPSEQRLMDYFRASIEHLPALLRGDDDPLKLLFPEGRLDVSQQLYEDALFNRWANGAAGAAVALLGEQRSHRRPLRILEVGAGGGGTTAAVLAALAGQDFEYLCTDLSPYFTGQAQARFADVAGMRFGIYDLNADYGDQGLSPNSYDLIVAGDVLHATSDIDRVLSQLRELVVPGGWLVALEMTRDHYQIMTSLELLVRLDEATGDFIDERQGTDLVFLSRERWLRALDRAGAHSAACLPTADSFIGEMGMCVLAAQFKADRTAPHPDDLDAHLRERLPDYMVPSVLQTIDQLPMTVNGKIDRRALARRLPRRQGLPVAGAAGAAPATDLERRLAAMWSEALGVPVTRDGNLFELGGDSLVAAQLAGRMIEEIAEAGSLFFDELLRNLLEQATVARLADWLVLTVHSATAADPQQEGADVPGELLISLAGQGAGVPRVFLPDAAGTLAGVETFAAGLSPLATCYGLTGGILSLLPAIEQVAAAWAQAVIDADLAQVEIYGQGPMAVLAVEVARNLTERGVLVEQVTLYNGHRPDPSATAEQVAAEHAALTGTRAPAASAEVFARVHQALARHSPAIYAGDITLVQPRGAAGTEFWEDVCLGDLHVVETSCTATELLWSKGPAASATPK